MKLDVKEVKLEIYMPEEFIVPTRDALTLIGACTIGDYDHVVSYQTSMGYWKPLETSNPFGGEKGKICSGTEVKMEVHCPIEQVPEAVKVIKKIHPYEEPVINIIPLLNALEI